MRAGWVSSAKRSCRADAGNPERDKLRPEFFSMDLNVRVNVTEWQKFYADGVNLKPTSHPCRWSNVIGNRSSNCARLCRITEPPFYASLMKGIKFRCVITFVQALLVRLRVGADIRDVRAAVPGSDRQQRGQQSNRLDSVPHQRPAANPTARLPLTVWGLRPETNRKERRPRSERTPYGWRAMNLRHGRPRSMKA